MISPPKFLNEKKAGPAKRPAYRLRQTINKISLESKLAIRQIGGSADDRLEPDIFIIGVQKAGTTSLHGHLARHPEIAPPLVKEVHYFDVAYHRGTRWYSAHFPKAADQNQRTFDTTPYYIFHPDVAERIYNYSPNAKIIAVLRDPVARAWSHYWHEWARGFEKLDPVAAFEIEPERLSDPHNEAGTTVGQKFAHQHYSYIARSEYDRQLDRWMAVFPKNQILGLKSESLFTDPEKALDQVSKFLNIAAFPSVQDRALNSGKYDAPPENVEYWLKHRLASSKERLEAMLGPEFRWI